MISIHLPFLIKSLTDPPALNPPPITDFCYGNEDLAFSISEAIKLCVTVVAYAPESFRR